ncbi:MAG: hypothetical protein IPK00_02260 [Deltaproteobacteria bacterium]|nr:hypothetical protein [Deltaproteobacteria bacterium]
MKIKLLVLALSISISIVLVEAALRLLYDVPPDWEEPQTRHLLDPQLGWILPHDDQSFTIDAPVETNSLGLRDDPMPIEKPPGETRILALGDSFTFALGVRFEDLYVQRLERLLNRESPGRRFQVINAGVAGYNTTQELVFLQADGLRYEPDLITIGFYWNDLLGNDKPLPVVEGPIRRDEARETESADPGHLLPAFIRNRMRRSLVLYLGVTRAKNVVAALGQPENELVGIQRDIIEGDADALERYWSATGGRLRELASAAAERGIPVLLVSFPMENQVRQPTPSPVYAEALRAEWAPTGMPMIELEAAYRASFEAGSNPYLPYDLHPGPIGMQIAADAIEGEIRRQGWLGLRR